MAFDLNSIKRGVESVPPRIVLYGVHGIGKSTLASNAPNPIFIQTEDRIAHIDTAKFPLCKSVSDVTSCLVTLYKEDHSFKTVVLDSLDWFEKLVHEEVRAEHGDKVFSDYGKGYLFAAPYFDKLLRGMDALRNDKGMGIILIAHSNIKRFNNPEAEPYDRYQLDLHDKAASTCEEWTDCVFFLNYKTFVAKEDVGFGKKQSRGVGTGARTIYTEERPAFHAKNSYRLPPELPMEWGAMWDAIAQGRKQAQEGKKFKKEEPTQEEQQNDEKKV
jgi:hypothetical protein